MLPVQISSKAQAVVIRALSIAGMVFFTLFCAFCCFYLLTGHDGLAKWYTGLNSCFYHSAIWGTDFFTPGIKSDGNMYAVIGLAISIAGFIFLFKHTKASKQPANPIIIRPVIPDVVCIAICIMSCIGLWVWGSHLALPAFDEVFSAQHVAGIHPFQGVSYYMQPNNHLFFNLLNNLLFHFATNKVITGRFLSLFAYCATIISVYWVLKSLFNNRWLALLMCITLAMQFFVWGFSFQARGYELYLLAEWGMVISLFCYIDSCNKNWLYVNVVCIITGYFCLPSFLYFHGAQMLFIALYQLCYKKRDMPIWKNQLIAILLTYLCYLPALCFSGIEAIINNSYVAPMTKLKTPSIFWEHVYPMFKVYLSHILSDIRIYAIDVTIGLLTLPFFLLLARKNKTLVLSGLFYLCMWITFLVVSTTMKRIPFERNLIGHYSVSLAALLLFVYWLTGLFKNKRIQQASLAIVLILFSFHFFSTNAKFLKETLYEYNVNEAYLFHKNRLNIIPSGSTIGFSDGEFYSLYICHKNKCTVNVCPEGDEDYYVTQDNDIHPAWMAGNYLLVAKVYGYEIYKHK